MSRPLMNVQPATSFVSSREPVALNQNLLLVENGKLSKSQGSVLHHEHGPNQE